jgi:hypothetical protein
LAKSECPRTINDAALPASCEITRFAHKAGRMTHLTPHAPCSHAAPQTVAAAVAEYYLRRKAAAKIVLFQ